MEASRLPSEHTEPTNGSVHLIVLQHGMWGNPQVLIHLDFCCCLSKVFNLQAHCCNRVSTILVYHVGVQLMLGCR